MTRSQIILHVLMPLLFVLLLTSSIALFFVREQLMPATIGHELSIGPTSFSTKIATDQFLVLIHKSHVEKLDAILAPLGLEVKFPLLNWIMVGKKNRNATIATQGSDEAAESRLTVSSLLENPLILDAHHNFLLEPTAKAPWPSAPKEHLRAPSEKHPFTLDLDAAWELTQGRRDVTITVVDEFSLDEKFNFASVFPGCASRVRHFLPQPLGKRENLLEQSPHGEPLLQALGACNNVVPFSTGIDSFASIVAAEPSSRGHAQVFLTALLAAGIDVCKESIIPCPANFAPPVANKKPDICLIAMGSGAPELLQISSDMIDALSARGVIVVTGAGNEHKNAQSFFPGAAAHAINVGALGENGIRAPFSNWGSSATIFAPGNEIGIAYPNGRKNISGTSIAAAFVAGTIGLLKAMRPAIGFEEARGILKRTAHAMSCAQYCADDKTCQQICCNDEKSACRLDALNLTQAVRDAQKRSSAPLLKLSQSYFLYLRDAPPIPAITVTNIGTSAAEVTVTSFDDHLTIAPQIFTLDPDRSETAVQELRVSFKREPFIRQIYKFALTARHNGVIVDQTEFYVEYIPKH